MFNLVKHSINLVFVKVLNVELFIIKFVLKEIWFIENKITHTRFFGQLCLLVPATRILLHQSAS